MFSFNTGKSKFSEGYFFSFKGNSLGASLNIASPGAAPLAPAAPSISGEATAALMGLGVNEVLARRAVDLALRRLGDDAPLAELIRAALQETTR